MKRRGLATAAFVGAFPVARRFGLDRGFDVYDDTFERAPGLHFDFAERRADRVVDAAAAWLATHARCRLPLGPPLRSARALRPARGLPRPGSLPRRSRLRRRDARPPAPRVGRAAGALGGRRDLGPRRGLRRARRREPRALRLRHHAARAPGAARRRTAEGEARRGARRDRGPRRDARRAGGSRAAAREQPDALRERAARAFRGAALRRDAGAPPRLRLERAAQLARRPLQVRACAAAGALRRRGRSWRDAQPRGLEPAGRGEAGSGARRGRWRDGATPRAGEARTPRRPSGCARWATSRARRDAAPARTPRTASRWRGSSRAPSARSPRRRS